MNRTCTSISAGLILLLVWSISICGGYETAIFMTIPTPMRSSGMGEVGVADDFDPGNAFYNPAIVSTLHGIYLSGGFYDHWSGDSWPYNAGVAVGVQTDPGEAQSFGVGAAFHYAGFSLDVPMTSASGTYAGEVEISERYVRLSLGGGITAGSIIHVGLGASVKSWMSSDFGEDRTAWAGDIGFLLRAAPVDNATMRMSTALGVTYANLGGDVDGTRLPRRLRAGLGFRVEGPYLDTLEGLLQQQLRAGSVAAYLDLVDRPEDSDPTIHAGLEVGLLEVFYLRTGYIYDRDWATNDPTYGAGLVIPLNPVMARLDYAHRSHGNDIDGENKFGAIAGIAF